MHYALRPESQALLQALQPLAEPEGFSSVLKANPYHDANGQFTSKDKDADGASSAEKPAEKPAKAVDLASKIKPAFAKGKKATIQDAGEALAKQGMKLKTLPTKNFQSQYEVEDKDGNTQVFGGKDLLKMLTKKSDPQLKG